MIIIEVIYSILCAVLPCTIYFTARKRKGYHLSILAMLIFVLYLWKVYDLTGAGGLTNIFYAPKGGDNTSIIQANINLIPFNIIEKTFYLNILMLVPLGALIGYIIWQIVSLCFGEHLKKPVKGKSDVIWYILLSFLGMFFLYYPFWFAWNIEPLIFQ